MAAIRHKLSARPSSGTPSAFSTRGGVVLLKTFASIMPLPISASGIRVARYQGKKLTSMAPPPRVIPMPRRPLRLPSCRGQNCGVQEMIETENHGMSLIRNRRWFLGALFSALLALALFAPGAATAQEAKQIKLTEKHIQGVMAAHKDMAKL